MSCIWPTWTAASIEIVDERLADGARPTLLTLRQPLIARRARAPARASGRISSIAATSSASDASSCDCCRSSPRRLDLLARLAIAIRYALSTVQDVEGQTRQGRRLAARRPRQRAGREPSNQVRHVVVSLRRGGRSARAGATLAPDLVPARSSVHPVTASSSGAEHRPARSIRRWMSLSPRRSPRASRRAATSPPGTRASSRTSRGSSPRRSRDAMRPRLAASFAMEASAVNASPASARSAACRVSSRAWSSPIFASTRRNETAWNSWIFFPNASRWSRTRPRTSSAARPIPSAFAASVTRERRTIASRRANPCPSSPIRRSLGAEQSRERELGRRVARGTPSWGASSHGRTPVVLSTTNDVMPFARVPRRHGRVHEVRGRPSGAPLTHVFCPSARTVAVARGRGRDRRGVRARSRLGDREPGHRRDPRCRAVDPALAAASGVPIARIGPAKNEALLDRATRSARHPRRAPQRSGTGADALHAAAAVAFRQVVAGEPDLRGPADHVGGELLVSSWWAATGRSHAVRSRGRARPGRARRRGRSGQGSIPIGVSRSRAANISPARSTVRSHSYASPFNPIRSTPAASHPREPLHVRLAR